jgi:hypothetical protein
MHSRSTFNVLANAIGAWVVAPGVAATWNVHECEIR